MRSGTRLLAAVGVIALIGLGIYAINQSQKSDIEKAGDHLEDAAHDVGDAVKDPD